jgi:hypothetical protein
VLFPRKLKRTFPDEPPRSDAVAMYQFVNKPSLDTNSMSISRSIDAALNTAKKSKSGLA